MTFALRCGATKTDGGNTHACVKVAEHGSDLPDMVVHRCACWHTWVDAAPDNEEAR